MCRAVSATNYKGLPNLSSDIGKKLQQKLPIRASTANANKKTDKITMKVKPAAAAEKPKYRLAPRVTKSPTSQLLFLETFRANPSSDDHLLVLVPSFRKAPPSHEDASPVHQQDIVPQDWNLMPPPTRPQDCVLTPRPPHATSSSASLATPAPPLPESHYIMETDPLLQHLPSSTFLPIF